jgi:hypothetical protein
MLGNLIGPVEFPELVQQLRIAIIEVCSRHGEDDWAILTVV